MSKKVAYVTGGMGGIGTAICQRLAKDGFKVIAGCGPNSPRKDRWLAEQKALGFDFTASEGNVGDWESTVAAFNKVKAEHGKVDVLVNNAGITRDTVFRKMTPEEIARVEEIVNVNIQKNLSVIRREMKREEAEALGAEMEFGAKYPDVVSVYCIEDETGNAISREFCGGPHIQNTSELTHFKIQKEEASSAGIRRIKAVLS